jgi:hypothetical protein
MSVLCEGLRFLNYNSRLPAITDENLLIVTPLRHFRIVNGNPLRFQNKVFVGSTSWVFKVRGVRLPMMAAC